jgi:hypothetical protein
MDKTRVVHIDEDLDFPDGPPVTGPGTTKRYLYTYPAHKAGRACAKKVKEISWRDVTCRSEP